MPVISRNAPPARTLTSLADHTGFGTWEVTRPWGLSPNFIPGQSRPYQHGTVQTMFPASQDRRMHDVSYRVLAPQPWEQRLPVGGMPAVTRTPVIANDWTGRGIAGGDAAQGYGFLPALALLAAGGAGAWWLSGKTEAVGTAVSDTGRYLRFNLAPAAVAFYASYLFAKGKFIGGYSKHVSVLGAGLGAWFLLRRRGWKDVPPNMENIVTEVTRDKPITRVEWDALNQYIEEVHKQIKLKDRDSTAPEPAMSEARLAELHQQSMSMVDKNLIVNLPYWLNALINTSHGPYSVGASWADVTNDRYPKGSDDYNHAVYWGITAPAVVRRLMRQNSAEISAAQVPLIKAALDKAAEWHQGFTSGYELDPEDPAPVIQSTPQVSR